MSVTTKSANSAPPVAEKRPHVTTHHGIRRVDDYAWLRARNWQEVMRDPSVLPDDIRAYLEAENAWTAAQMADTEALQKTLFAEMKGRIKEEDSSVPAPDGPFAYYVHYVKGGQHPLYCRKPRDGGAETVLLDGNALARPHSYFRLGTVAHSPDHRLIGYAADDTGSEFYTLRFRRADDGSELGVDIADTTGGFIWAQDGKTVFYTRVDDNHRPKWVFRRNILDAPDEEILVYEEADAGFFVGVGQTQSRQFILIDAHDHTTSEVWLIDAAHPETAPRLVAEREKDHEYDVDHAGAGEQLIIRTNADGAEDFKIAEAPLAAPGRENWRDLVPHQPGHLILSHTCYKAHWVRMVRDNGLPRILLRRYGEDRDCEIGFEEEAYSLGVSPGYEFDTQNLRYTYSSPTTPAQIWDYDISSGTRILRKTQEVPSGHEPADYVTRRLQAPAHDGEQVPITLLYHRQTPLDGSAPVLLYGYGAYGISIPASFSTNPLSLVDRGFIYAIAHIRGGKDKGYRWYRLGRGEHKVNSFKDFISAAEFLVAEGLTQKGRIVAQGGSAGGMLMGAVANMAPDLWGGIIAEVPFVDVLTTMLDDTLPLTPPEWPEWGNPIKSRKAYELIASYSPYDNVSARAYPPIFAVAGLTDPRVTYWEPAKWVAKLRALRTDDNLLLLKTNMAAGHAGASGRFDRLKEVALVYAFALKLMGQTQGQPAAS